MSHLTYLYAEKLTDAPQALVEKLTESETAKNWDQFYSRHENKFYKGQRARPRQPAAAAHTHSSRA